MKDIESIVYRTPKQNSPMKATTPATVHFLDGETHTFHIDVSMELFPLGLSPIIFSLS